MLTRIQHLLWFAVLLVVAATKPTTAQQKDEHTGVVNWFNDGIGYGFITPDDHSADVFVHYSAIEWEGWDLHSFHKGQKVRYELVEDSKGRQAAHVHLIK